MKKLLWALPLLAVPFIIAASNGPPAPYSWFRAGPVDFGSLLYTNDIVVGQNSTVAGYVITHHVTSFDIVDGGTVHLPQPLIAGLDLVIGNTTGSTFTFCPQPGGYFSDSAPDFCINFNAHTSRECYATTTLQWECK